MYRLTTKLHLAFVIPLVPSPFVPSPFVPSPQSPVPSPQSPVPSASC
ncbi:hypothetical protein FDUTEX481_09502 [Tolypothrix sp. PCC 7601]|nr:hypothetical protein FDUTEX481_09502 [Tolypothrix sp. PCC 7601]